MSGTSTVSTMETPNGAIDAPSQPNHPTPRWRPLRYHPEQARLWFSSARFRLVAAGRSSGKTELAKRRVALCLSDSVPDCPSPMYFISGPTHDQVRRIYWDDIKDLIPGDWIASVSESELKVTTIFGSSVYLTGLDKPQRIEGSHWCGGVVDECSDIKPGAWSRSIRPALSQFSGWCWRIGVPKRFGVGAVEFHKAWDKAKGGAGVSDAFWWKSADILTPEEMTIVREDVGPDDFEEQYEAKWLDRTGAIFSSFDSTKNVIPVEYDPTQIIYVGDDFNVNPMAWALAHERDGVIRQFDELWLRNTNTQEALTSLYNRYPEHHSGWVFTGDASSKARKTSATQTDYAIICNDTRFQGKRVVIGDKNPGVADRIAATNRQLCDASGKRSLFISPKCTHTIEDLRLRSSLGSVGDIGHMSDALGYLIWTLFPLRVVMPEPGLRRVDSW